MKKKMIVLIAFIYIASMLFCGDGVGKKFVEEKFPHLTYSDKECDDSKKKELRIVEDEDTAGGILSYEELAAMENENASVRNNMLPDTDQLAFVDEAEKNGELAELKEQQNVKMPQVDMSFDNLVKNYYQVDKTTYIGADELCEEVLLGRDMSIEKSGNGPDILIYHTHSQEGYSDSLDTSEAETVVGVAETTRLAATIDGKPMAQIMFFNGLCRTAARGPINSLPNEYLGDNLAFSFQLQLMANEYYPGLARRIYLKGYRYNMHLCPKSLLVEVGAQTNTKEEAYNAMEPLADILDKVLK